MTISAYVIDDEFFAVDLLTDYIRKTPGLELAGSTTNPLTGLEQLTTSSSAPDIIFVDLEMPQLHGLSLAKMLPQQSKIVFTTSHRNFGPEAFETGAVDYLLKPFTYERFLSCVSKIRKGSTNEEFQKAAEPSSFFVKADIKGKLVRVMAKEIFYISSELNYVNIHLATEKIKAYLTMGEILEQLPGDQFIQTHRSFIVNIDRVRILEPGLLRLDNHVAVDIGPKFKEQLLQKLGSRLIVSHRNPSGQ
ncbi:MAG: response regulator transcription factor [Mucilaginibacter sp.]|nr:response regulator transcription factor [Mucilaginibacter sp.]